MILDCKNLTGRIELVTRFEISSASNNNIVETAALSETDQAIEQVVVQDVMETIHLSDQNQNSTQLLNNSCGTSAIDSTLWVTSAPPEDTGVINNVDISSNSIEPVFQHSSNQIVQHGDVVYEIMTAPSGMLTKNIYSEQRFLQSAFLSFTFHDTFSYSFQA